MIYVIPLLIFLFIWALFSAIIITVFGKKKAIDKLKYFDEDYNIQETIEKSKKKKKQSLKFLSGLVPSTIDNKKNKKLELELMRADLPITVSEMVVIRVISSVVLGALSFILSQTFIFAIVVFIATWSVPNYIIASKKKERVKEFDNQLNDGLTIISNSLKAGYSFLQAVAVVTEEMPDPFSKEFKKLLKEMSLGLSEEESFKNLTNRMESEDLKLIINAIVIQKDVGGNLSEILDNISETIRDRQKIKNELRTLTAQGKLSGGIVAALPIFLGLVIFLLNREYVTMLFTTSIGLFMVVASVISEMLGFWMIRKIVDIKM
ncbi:type II secretion system F family protein [Alkalicella caledoniensis]|uniref:Type II secretion system F family protein n=1 Tax=Alkalicella caledoniensis TaxID=2731377 RepID=A0A7G9WD74_ALKCA|nr:type II secretion system F family protein [Alkalicella caledoniensis]